MATLKLEKRGMDFVTGDERVTGSDVGNYRVTTNGYDIPGRNGRTYHLEVMRGDKYRTRYTNKRTGKPLAKPVREMVASCVSFVNACYRDADGCCWGDCSLWQDAFDKPRPYTVAGILDLVNSFAAVHYDSVEFVRG